MTRRVRVGRWPPSALAVEELKFRTLHGVDAALEVVGAVFTSVSSFGEARPECIARQLCVPDSAALGLQAAHSTNRMGNIMTVTPLSAVWRKDG